jgi:hypothetical protein
MRPFTIRQKISETMKGHSITEYTRNKMSNAQKGKKFTEEHKNNLKKSRVGKTPMLGKRHSEETKKKMKRARSGKPSLLKGIKQSMKVRINQSLRQTGDSVFKGFKTPERLRIRHSPEYTEWRLQVFGRDNYTCQNCNKRGVYLEAHHIKPFADFPELRFAINNGITYCLDCHMKVDTERNKFKNNGQNTKDYR